MSILQRELVYQLKRQFGRRVYYYDLISRTVSRQTGEAFYDYTLYEIKKAIILSATESRKFAYDLAFIAAAKNFTSGGYFDSSARMIIIDRRDLPVGFEMSNSDRLTFDGRRYEVSEFEEFEESYAVICKANKSVQEYDKAVQDLITAGWSGDFVEQVALDELARKVRNIFEGRIPDTFFLWPCCGDTLSDALKTLYHDDVTNVGFVAADYKSRGVNGGLQGDAVAKYINTGYPFNADLNLANYHMSVFCEEVDVTTSEYLLGATDVLSADNAIAILGGNVIGALGDTGTKVDWLVTRILGHFMLVSNSNNSMKAFYNGVEEDENTSVRSITLPTIITPFIFANNNNGTAEDFTSARIKTVTIGEGLTDAQVLSLYNAIQIFNERLGRA